MASRKLSTTIKEASFLPWSELPTELQLEVLSHVVAEPNPITHRTSRKQQMSGTGIWNIVSTRNRNLVDLALDAYYKSNTFAMDRSYPPVKYGSIVERVAINVTEEIEAAPAMIFSTVNQWHLFMAPIKANHTYGE